MSTTIHLTKTLSLAAIYFCLSTTSAFAAEPSGHSHDHAGAPVKLSLNESKKWASDEPLRKAMTNIRNAMEESLHAIHEGKLSVTKYGALAKKVNGEVATW
jgi:hypothetical protein